MIDFGDAQGRADERSIVDLDSHHLKVQDGSKQLLLATNWGQSDQMEAMRGQ